MLHISGHVCLARHNRAAARKPERRATADHCHIDASWGRMTIRTDAGHRLAYHGNRVAMHDGRLSAEALQSRGAGNGAFLVLELPESPDAPFILHTDRLGTIPVYYGRQNDRLVFASRLPLLMDSGFDSPDPLGVAQMMLLGYPLGARSLLKDVRLAPPASAIRMHPDGSVTSERYWQPVPNPEPGPIPPELADGLLEHLQAAHHRATPNGEDLAMPITGGLDSRLNLALHRHRLPSAFLFHVGLPRDPEGAIARRISRILGLPMADLRLNAHLLGNELARLAGGETGELNPAQLWLARVGAFVQEHAADHVLLDGYLQDALFNPRLVTDQAQHQRDAAVRLARLRWSSMGASLHAPLLSRVLDSIDAEFGLSQAPSPLAASQRFYLENRSRRFVFGTARLAQDHIAVATPGLDNELMDFALALPWGARHGGPLYRALIMRLAPDLAGVAYDKTGRPLKHGLRVARRRHVAKTLYRGLDRVWPTRPLLRTAPSPMRLLLGREEAVSQIRGLLNGSRWVKEFVEAPDTDVLEPFLRHARPSPVTLLAALVALAQLEACNRARSGHSEDTPCGYN